jgi:preprotein translocase subunit SecA
MITTYCSENPHPDFWDWDAIRAYANGIFGITDELDLTDEEFAKFNKDDLHEKLIDIAHARYEAKEEEIGSDLMREIERVVMLRTVDQHWMDHIDAMDQLKNGINLRAYAQRDPVIEYKFEGFEMFEEMIRAIQEDVVRIILNTRFDTNKEIKREKVAEPIAAIHGESEEVVKKTVVHKDKVGRNDDCPCGSGKKYKNCHGA